MGRTIIQPIGPLYGEAVNGTVSGRPNGSVYVPPTNTIELVIPETVRYVKNNGGQFRICSSGGSGRNYNINAISQDLASNVQVQVFSDPDCAAEDLLGYTNRTAGQFNYGTSDITNTTSTTIIEGTSYYVRAQLMNNGTAVATSDVIEVQGVVPA